MTHNTFDYKQYGSSILFNSLLRDILKKGIYKGGKMSKIGPLEVGVNPYVVLMEDTFGSNPAALRIWEDSQKAVSVTASYPYIVLLFDIIETPETEPTFVIRSQAQINAGLPENEICFGKANIIGGVIDTTTPFIYDEADYGFLYNESFTSVSQLKSWAEIKTGINITEDSDIINLKYFLTELDEFLDNKTDKLIPFGDGDRFYSHSSSLAWDNVAKQLQLTGGITLTKNPVTNQDVGNRAYNDARYLSNFSFTDAVSPLLLRLDYAEIKNLEQEKRIGYLEGRQSYNSDMIYDMFLNRNLSKKLRQDIGVDNEAEIFIDEYDKNNNWYSQEGSKPDFLQGALRPKKKWYYGEIIDKYDFTNIGSMYKGPMSRYDVINDCYWLLTNNETAAANDSEIIKLSRNFQIQGRWFLDDGDVANALWTGIDVTLDGEYLIILGSHISGGDWSALGKLSINHTDSIFNGSLGMRNKKSGTIIAWSDNSTWNVSTSDFTAVNDLDRLAASYYNDVTCWDADHIIIMKGNNSASEYTMSLIFVEIDHYPVTGEFKNINPKSAITGFHALMRRSNAPIATNTLSSTSMIKINTSLYVRINWYGAGYEKKIFKFDCSESGSNYSGDFIGVIVGGTPKVIKSHEILELHKPYPSAPNNYYGREAISISHDGHLLDLRWNGYSTNYNEYTLYKRALLDSVFAENQMAGVLSVNQYSYSSPYPNDLLDPRACMVEYTGGEYYYWTGDYGATLNQVDVFRYKVSDGTYKHARLTGDSWTGLMDLTNDGTNLYLLGTDGTNYEVYSGTLSSFVSAMGNSYVISNTINLTTWGSKAAGIGAANTNVLVGICYRTANGAIYLVNDTDDAIDTLSANGVTWTQGVIKLPVPQSAWRGLAYKDNMLYVVDGYNGDGPSLIYEIDISLSTASKFYRTHTYGDASYNPFSTNGIAGLDFEDNDLVVIGQEARKFFKIKTLYDPAVLQLHSFVDWYNVLLNFSTTFHTPIIERSFDPDEFYEYIDGVAVKSRENVPDKYYQAIGYGVGNGSTTFSGFSLLMLDEFLNSESNKTTSGMDRYDVRKIRTMHFKGGGANLGASNIMYHNTPTVSQIVVEKEQIMVVTKITGYYGYIWIDLLYGRAFLGYNTATNTNGWYNGRLKDRNNNLGYTTSTNYSYLDLSSIVNYQVTGKTFYKDDSSTYNKEYPTTYFLIGGNTGLDLLIVEWGINNERTPLKTVKALLGSTSRYEGDQHRITEEGKFIYFGTASTTYIHYSNKYLWEIYSADDLDTTTQYQYITLPYSYGRNISHNIKEWKTSTGQWRHILFIGATDIDTGYLRFYKIDLENKTFELMWNFDTPYTYPVSSDSFEDLFFGLTGKYYDSILYKLLIYKKYSFNDRPSHWNNIVDEGYNNWSDRDQSITYNCGVTGYSENRPYITPGIRSIAGDSDYSSLRYSKDFGILSLNYGNGSGYTTGRYVGLQLLHIYPYINECIHESLDVELVKNPERLNFKRTAILPCSEKLKRILINDSTVVYDVGWVNTGALTETQLENANDVVFGYGSFGNGEGTDGFEIFKSTGDRLVDGVDFENDSRIDTAPYDIYDDSNSGIFGSGKYLRIVNDGDNINNTLALQVYAKDMEFGAVAPNENKAYVDILRGKFVLPRPVYWSKCESIANATTNAEIGSATISGIGGVSNNALWAKWGYCLYRSSNSLSITSYTISNSLLEKGTFSCWTRCAGGGTAKFYLYLSNDVYIASGEVVGTNGIYIGGVLVAGTTFTTEAGVKNLYVIWDKAKSLTDGCSIRVYENGILKSSTTNSITTVGTANIKFSQYTINYSICSIDNVKLWNDIIEDTAMEYNSGTGNENALHPCYGIGASYNPGTLQVGYYSKSVPTTPAYLPEASAGAFSTWTISENTKMAGIWFKRSSDSGIANISLYNITDATYEFENNLIDLYNAVDVEFVYWYNLDVDKTYRFEITHNGTHNASAGATYNIYIRRYFEIQDLNRANIEHTVTLWHTDYLDEYVYLVTEDTDQIDIIKQQTFNGDGCTKAFTLTEINRAYKLHTISKDSGVAWLFPSHYSLTWGTNAPLYDNQQIDENGSTTVFFSEAPETGTDNIIIRYVPRINMVKIQNKLIQPKNESITDNRSVVRLLDYFAELY